MKEMKLEILLLLAPGSGASGIPLADRLSESGKSVLLIERGFASSGRWGGDWRPSWLDGTNLTRFDVPALAQLVWTPEFNNAGIFCDGGSPSPAGCLLGGGPAINAGQFYMPTPNDFNLNQPPGFQYSDMSSAIRKVSERLPWTDTPSMDGKRYLGNGSTVAISTMTNPSVPGHYRFIAANEDSDRNRTTSHAAFFFQNGEKAGPMATYLVSASQRKNFRLVMNTTVTHVLRDSDTATGVVVESSGDGGLSGTISLTPNSGRVILAAGVFNTFKILLHSSIGPTDQLSALAANKSTSLLPRTSWLELPIGRNLDDAPNFYIGVSVPNIEHYPWESLWSSSIENPDIAQYLTKRSGPLAELQSPLNAVSWDTVQGADGKTRVLQSDSTSGRSSQLPGDGSYIVFGSTLTLGHTSRGQLSFDPSSLSVSISKTPYLNDPGNHDFAAVLNSATNIISLINATILQNFPEAFMIYPGPDQSLKDYLQQAPRASSNHWVGTAKMGETCEDEGAVVDISTRVCGMKNLHVVDASIFNGVPSANPQATLIVMAERAAEVIIGLD
ncbi:cellobiose dehydrogenase [Phaeosphaeria sp. MPI-PUGE-AT-0046c]|nr:cellobiose dehydrogenase [Phaeosphaeria sp. MPI-PUGE-AT-0046c]